MLEGVEVDANKEIDTEPPPGFFDKETPSVADVGQPITACFLTKSNTDPTNWWVSAPFSLLSIYSNIATQMHLFLQVDIREIRWSARVLESAKEAILFKVWQAVAASTAYHRQHADRHLP